MSCHQQGPATVLQARVWNQWADRAAITNNFTLKDFLNYKDVPHFSSPQWVFLPGSCSVVPAHRDHQELPMSQVSTQETNPLEYCSLWVWQSGWEYLKRCVRSRSTTGSERRGEMNSGTAPSENPELAV